MVKGKSIIREIENTNTTAGDVPVSPVVIEDCGELSPDDPSLTNEASANLTEGGDPYEDWPEDEESGDTEKPEVALKIASDVRQAATILFKKGDISNAFTKYQSMSFFIYISHSVKLLFQSLFDILMSTPNPPLKAQRPKHSKQSECPCYSTSLSRPLNHNLPRHQLLSE